MTISFGDLRYAILKLQLRTRKSIAQPVPLSLMPIPCLSFKQFPAPSCQNDNQYLQCSTDGSEATVMKNLEYVCAYNIIQSFRRKM